MHKLAISAFALTFAIGGAACGGDDDGGGSAASFCDTAREFDEKYADDTLEFPDEEALDDLRELADDAPSEIRDDVNQVVDAFEAFLENQDDPEALAELEDDFADVDEASTRVETYLEDECGIDTDDEGGGDDTGDDATVEE